MRIFIVLLCLGLNLHSEDSFNAEAVILPAIGGLLGVALICLIAAVVVSLRKKPNIQPEGPKKRTALASLACLVFLGAYVMVCDWFGWKPGANGDALRYIVFTVGAVALFKKVRG
jgi:hypothetical protein